MIKQSFLGALALLSVLALATPAAAATQNCALSEQASLPMTFLPDGSFTVPVTVGGHPWNMKLDLSVPFTSVFANAPGEAGLKASALGEREYVLYATRIVSTKVTFPGMQLGRVNVPAGEALVVPVNPQSSVTGAPLPAGYDGTLGRDLLDHFDLEFDFAHQTLNLFAHNACSGQAVYWADSAGSVAFDANESAAVLLPAELDGKSMQAVLDTMVGNSRLASDMAQSMFSIGPGSQGVQQVARDGLAPVYRYGFHKLAIGPAIFADPVIDIVPADSTARNGIEMLQSAHVVAYDAGNVLHLGVTQLRKLRIYLSWNDAKLYFTAVGATKSPAPAGAPTE
jgi:hypothetical protein